MTHLRDLATPLCVQGLWYTRDRRLTLDGPYTSETVGSPSGRASLVERGSVSGQYDGGTVTTFAPLPPCHLPPGPPLCRRRRLLRRVQGTTISLNGFVWVDLESVVSDRESVGECVRTRDSGVEWDSGSRGGVRTHPPEIFVVGGGEDGRGEGVHSLSVWGTTRDDLFDTVYTPSTCVTSDPRTASRRVSSTWRLRSSRGRVWRWGLRRESGHASSGRGRRRSGRRAGVGAVEFPRRRNG